VRALTERQLTSQTIDAYLDDEPDIPSIYERAATPNLVVVPFFLASGSHVSIDVPNAMGLPLNQSQAVIKDKQVYYTDPIGTEATLCEMIIDLAHDAGMPERQHEGSTTLWRGYPTVGQQALVNEIREKGEVIFGELRLTLEKVRPVAMDAHPVVLESPSALRSHIREEPFRPLASAKGLPRDWEAPVQTVDDIPAVVETIYPGTVAAVAHAQTGSLEVTALAQTLQRQQGNFRKLEALEPAAIDETVAKVCSQCIKQPLWYTRSRELDDGIPCPEACNFWMSKALEALS
jgi:hypothetical protein